MKRSSGVYSRATEKLFLLERNPLHWLRFITGFAMPLASLPNAAQGRPLWRLPFSLTILFFAFSFTPHVQGNLVLVRSFWAATAILLLWQFLLFDSATRNRRKLHLEVALRKHHYIQAAIQLAIFVYWGWYFRQVYDEADLILAQVAFAYVVDMLLCWSRREKWVLGFGPFPIVFSTNLFLWFKDDWFYLQFLMLAVGFLGKEFIRWNREGKRVHIFNPSAFSLGLFSLGLILTNGTDITWGIPIASTLKLPPNIYFFLFLLGLVVMYFFSITLVAAFAAATMFGLSAAYTSVTGVYYFLDAEIPIAVFLGLHLLVTDPSTSPRSGTGKMIFGVLYGAGVFALFSVLGWLGVPTFYDKLLCVPFLNLSVRAIDRLAASPRMGWLRLEWLRLPLSPAQINLAHIGVWIAFFLTMAGIGSAGDFHEGATVPFWQGTCDDGLRKGCENLVRVETFNCEDGSGWACNELGIHTAEGLLGVPEAEASSVLFSRACELGFIAGCTNMILGAIDPMSDAPTEEDFRILLRGGKAPLTELTELELSERACQHGWADGCLNMAGLYLRGADVDIDPGRAVSAYERACDLGLPAGCATLGQMYQNGEAIEPDEKRASALFEKACKLGLSSACTDSEGAP